jgi:hypothetical protein
MARVVLILLCALLTGAATAAQRSSPSHAAPAAKSDDSGPPPSEPSEEPEGLQPKPEPSLPRFDPKWRTCKEDKDCAPIDTHCGWGCINGASERPASMYYRQLAPFIECSATSADDKPTAICVKKECVCQK